MLLAGESADVIFFLVAVVDNDYCIHWRHCNFQVETDQGWSFFGCDLMVISNDDALLYT